MALSFLLTFYSYCLDIQFLGGNEKTRKSDGFDLCILCEFNLIFAFLLVADSLFILFAWNIQFLTVRGNTKVHKSDMSDLRVFMFISLGMG